MKYKFFLERPALEEKKIKIVKDPIDPHFVDSCQFLGESTTAYLIMRSKENEMTFCAKGEKISVVSKKIASLFENAHTGWSRDASEDEIYAMRELKVMRDFLDEDLCGANPESRNDDEVCSFDGYDSDSLLTPTKDEVMKGKVVTWKHTPG